MKFPDLDSGGEFLVARTFTNEMTRGFLVGLM